MRLLLPLIEPTLNNAKRASLTVRVFLFVQRRAPLRRL
jgi:hypothetical protein